MTLFLVTSIFIVLLWKCTLSFICESPPKSYEQQFGKIYRFEKALLVIKFTKYCYWGSVGLENIGSDWGPHLTNFQFSDIFVVFVSVLLSDGISFLHFPNLRTSLQDHLAAPSHFLPQFSYQWVLRQLFRFVSVLPHLPGSLSHLTIHPEKKLCKCLTWPHMLLIRANDSVKQGSQSQAGMSIHF